MAGISCRIDAKEKPLTTRLARFRHTSREEMRAIRPPRFYLIFVLPSSSQQRCRRETHRALVRRQTLTSRDVRHGRITGRIARFVWDLRLFWQTAADGRGTTGYWVQVQVLRRIRGVLSPPANGTGSPPQHFTCHGSPPARTSLARRARREGEGALEACGTELARPAESIARVGHGSDAHSDSRGVSCSR